MENLENQASERRGSAMTEERREGQSIAQWQARALAAERRGRWLVFISEMTMRIVTGKSVDPLKSLEESFAVECAIEQQSWCDQLLASSKGEGPRKPIEIIEMCENCRSRSLQMQGPKVALNPPTLNNVSARTTFDILRALARDALSPMRGVTTAREERMAALFVALDTWISNGGPLPGGWTPG